MSGPETMPICAMPITMPMYIGILAFGTLVLRIPRLPFERPLIPIPEIALPTMNMVDDLATPQIKDPSSNKKTNDRNVPFVLNSVYSFPARGIRVAAASVYAPRYQPMSGIEWNSVVILGMACIC